MAREFDPQRDIGIIEKLVSYMTGQPPVPLVVGMPGMVTGPILGSQGIGYARHLLRQPANPPRIADETMYVAPQLEATNAPPWLQQFMQAMKNSGTMPSTKVSPVRISSPYTFGDRVYRSNPVRAGMDEKEGLQSLLFRALQGTSSQ